MSSKLTQKKNVKTASGGKISGGKGSGSEKVRLSENQRKKNRRLLILSIAAVIAGLLMSLGQSLSNEYAAVFAFQEKAFTEAAALKTAAEDLLASKNAEAIADSEGMKSLKDAAGHLSDAAGILELHAAVDEIVLAAALLPEEAKKGGTDLSSEIKAVYDAAKKTEAALTAANAGAEGFNQKRRKIYNKVLADTMGLSEIETW